MQRTRNAKTGNLSISSGLSLGANKELTKTIKFGKRNYKARHVVIPANEVEHKTKAHHLNTRSQDSLTEDALKDIYLETLNDGIKQEGLAYYNKELDRYELLDGSRRRACAVRANVSLPLWVLDEQPSDMDIIDYIDLTQKVRLMSWREVGARYINYAEENKIDKNDFDRLAEAFNVSSVTIRKKINAAMLNEELINSFPDCQGIPTTFYAKLGKLERLLNKHARDVAEFVAEAKATFETDSTDIGDVQADLLKHYETKADILGEHKKPTATKSDLTTFSDKNTYARMTVSADGRKTTLEFSRLPKDVLADIEEYVRQKVSEIA